jgi:dihydrofolate synthase/folylpolyglutamate synthase
MPKELEVKDLSAWLSYIESLHPKSIAMGLDRIKFIISRLNLEPRFTIITVAGTNGKGSTCAMLENIYRQAGYQVGCYTSPHLLRYNERVRINGTEVNDADLCKAFEAVDAARVGEDGSTVALTYFEVGTLAAVWHFMQAKIDVAVLEIGLGGRLDAVNAFEPDCAIVTSVDLDHMEFLGDTREKIGFEKAGVYRKAAPAICGDNNPPASLVEHAKQIHADLKCIDKDFGYSVVEDGWQYQLGGKVLHTLPIPALKGDYQLNNAACAVTAIESLQAKLPVPGQAIADAMRQVTLAARFQTVAHAPQVILDVAHNPHAARALAENLRATSSLETNTIAVFAMLADKDIKGVVEAVRGQIDTWYIASIDNVRGASATDLAAVITAVNPAAKYKMFENAAVAYQQACIDAGENDKIVVFGSFFTVSNVMQILRDHSKN